MKGHKLKKISKFNIKKPYLVYVEWYDAIANNGWFTYDELLEWVNDNADRTIKESGFLIHKDDNCVVIASRQGGFTDPTNYGLIQWIPRPWVKILKRIKE